MLWTEPGPPGAPRPPDMQPDPVVVPEVRPGTDGGDQEVEAASHDAGAADGPEQRADPEREDAEDAFIDDDDDNELDLQAAAGDRAAGSTEPPAAAADDVLEQGEGAAGSSGQQAHAVA